ncbi:MAG TPA: hypothetical protein VGK03_00420 [Geothrix sp.]|jgi:hypothetical protein
MIRRLTRLWPWLVPWDEHPDMEIRLFRKVSLASACLAIGAVLPANYFQNLPASLNLAVFAFGILSYALYRASMRGVHAAKTFCVLLLLLLDFSWFQNAGSKGTIGMFMFFAVMVLTTFFKGRVGWAALAVYLANGLVLLWMEQAFPHFVVPYAREVDRLSDFATSFVISTLVCVLVLRVVMAAYDRERRRLTATNAKLEQSLAEIRTLQGLLPICSWCKKIRDDAGLWTQVEDYLAEHTEASFTHGLCPDCVKTHFPGKQAQRHRHEGQDQDA